MNTIGRPPVKRGRIHPGLRAAIEASSLLDYQIAYGAGWSQPGQLSRLIRGDFPLTEETIARIQAMADIVGYKKPKLLTVDAETCPHCGKRAF